jgi:hypothetical protein
MSEEFLRVINFSKKQILILKINLTNLLIMKIFEDVSLLNKKRSSKFKLFCKLIYNNFKFTQNILSINKFIYFKQDSFFNEI